MKKYTALIFVFLAPFLLGIFCGCDKIMEALKDPGGLEFPAISSSVLNPSTSSSSSLGSKLAQPNPNSTPTVNTTNVNLSWTVSPGASGYEVAVTGPNIHLVSYYSVSGCSNTNLAYNTPYFGHYQWTVKAVDITSNSNSAAASGGDFYCVPKAASLVIYYPLNGKDLDGSNNPKDLTGNSTVAYNSNTIINTWGYDTIWHSYHFNGTSSSIILNPCSAIDNRNVSNYSIVFRYKTSADNYGAAILSKGYVTNNDSSGSAWDFGSSQGAGPISFWGEWLHANGYYVTNVSVKPVPVETAGQIGTSVWHHVAMTFDGTNENLYIDGASANPGASFPSKGIFNPYNTNNLILGARQTNLDKIGGFYNGDIYNLMIFTNALSSNDMLILYQSFYY